MFQYRNATDKTIHTKIYDRWGKLVINYSGNESWEGKGAAAGTYFYVIKAGGEVYKGSVTLVR